MAQKPEPLRHFTECAVRAGETRATLLRAQRACCCQRAPRRRGTEAQAPGSPIQSRVYADAPTAFGRDACIAKRSRSALLTRLTDRVHAVIEWRPRRLCLSAASTRRPLTAASALRPKQRRSGLACSHRALVKWRSGPASAPSCALQEVVAFRSRGA